MNKAIPLRNKLIITIGISLIFGFMLAWEHFNGGVASHYLLHNKDLPAISNWWGLIILPLLSMFVLFNVEGRWIKHSEKSIEDQRSTSLKRFIYALAFGILMSILFTIESPVLEYLLLSLLLLAFFVPLFYTEYWLGYVIGTMFTFGVFIPFIFGALLILIFWLLFHISKLLKSLFKP